MNTFQQQYLSVLGAATGKKFLEAATGNKELISKDKTMMNDMAGEVNESIQSKKHAKHFAGMIARAQDADPLSMDAETLTEVNSTLYAQQRKINELQRG